eukprot:gene31008-53240_t
MAVVALSVVVGVVLGLIAGFFRGVLEIAIMRLMDIVLTLPSLLLAIVIGVPAGLVSAVYRDRWPDYVSRVLSLASVSMPRFFLGLLLQLGLAMQLGWLPLSGRFPLALDPPPHFT